MSTELEDLGRRISALEQHPSITGMIDGVQHYWTRWAPDGGTNAPIHPIGDGLAEPASKTLPPTGAIGCSPIPDAVPVGVLSQCDIDRIAQAVTLRVFRGVSMVLEAIEELRLTASQSDPDGL